MELNEKYVYQVYIAKSFTKAAKSLYISQPSLSAAIAAKEAELGFRIFDRTTKPITLTREGEIYIEMLEEIIRCENNMFHRLKQLNEPPRKKIAIGSSIYTSYFLIPTICGAFYRRYPDINVILDIGNTNNTSNLFQKLNNKQLDIVFSYECNKTDYHCYPIFEERMVVAMRKSFLTPSLLPFVVTRDELLNKTFSPEKEQIDIRLLRDIPFLSFSKSGSAFQYMTSILKHYAISNHVVENAKHSGVHFNMMCAGTGAIITSDSAIRVAGSFSDDIVCFIFPKDISTRKIFSFLRKNDTIDKVTESFLKIATEVCASDKGISLYYP